MNRIWRSLAIRPGEGRGIALVAALFAIVEAGRGFGEVGSDTMLLSRVGPGPLPLLYVGLGLASLVVALGFGAAVGRLRMGPLFVGILLGFAGLLILLGVLARGAPTGLFPAIWLVVYGLGTIEGTLVWSLAGAVFDARQAKRLFPICTSAAILGGFVGTLGSGPIARIIGAETLVAVDGVFLVAAAAVGVRLSGVFNRPLTARPRAMPLTAQVRAGFEYVRSSPLMRLVAIAYVLFSVLAFAVSFPFLRAMATAFPNEADLATALGLLAAAVTATSFVVSIGVANRIYARFGIATAALVLPIVYLLGFGTWIVALTVTTAVIVRLSQQVAQRGLSNAAWSAFYNVVPRERRAQVLSFMDGVPGQLGTSLSGLLLIAAGAFLSPTQVPWIGLVAALVLIWVVLQVRHRYAESLVATLRAGLAEQMLEGGPGLVALAADPQVIDELTASLADRSPQVRVLSAELLGRLGRHEALEGLIALLSDEAPAVRVAALDAIGQIGGTPPAPALVEVAGLLRDDNPSVRVAAVKAAGLLDNTILVDACDAIAMDPEPAVRAELAKALIVHGAEERPHAILAALLESPDAADRVAGLAAVARIGGHMPSPRLTESLSDPAPIVRAAAVEAVGAIDVLPDRIPLLVGALDDEAATVRTAAAAALADQFDEARSALLDVLESGSGPAQEAALRALGGHGDEVRDMLLAWSARQVDRAETLRDHARALDAAVAQANGSADGRASGAVFLRDILRRREWQIEERLLLAVAVAGAPEASGLLRRCLRSNDAETRAQAMEALDTIGDRVLGRSVVRLLESDDDGSPRGNGSAGRSDDILRALTADPDPWVRAIAVHARSRLLTDEWQAMIHAARDDTSALVRSVATDVDARGAVPMPETRETLGEIERMLFLRRVPLFSDLTPEDLQRIGRTAVERLYGPGEEIVREGDLGDQLVVIVEGDVRVVRSEGGQERVLTRFSAGDHIGELAVLRERPRAATVIAEGTGVRGLVIDGEGLRAILRERPEAAMAMLATLAERISSA